MAEILTLFQNRHTGSRRLYYFVASGNFIHGASSCFSGKKVDGLVSTIFQGDVFFVEIVGLIFGVVKGICHCSDSPPITAGLKGMS